MKPALATVAVLLLVVGGVVFAGFVPESKPAPCTAAWVVSAGPGPPTSVAVAYIAGPCPTPVVAVRPTYYCDRALRQPARDNEAANCLTDAFAPLR